MFPSRGSYLQCFVDLTRLYTVYSFMEQEQVSGNHHQHSSERPQSDTLYTVTLIPVYAESDGQRMSENGKTSEFLSETLVSYSQYLAFTD